MWRTEPTDQWRLAAINLSETHSDEMAALIRNLIHFKAQLNVTKTHKTVEALYLHRNISSIVALDTRGMNEKLKDYRLYTFPDDQKRTLHLLTIGEETQKDSDMEYCKLAVLSIVNQHS